MEVRLLTWDGRPMPQHPTCQNKEEKCTLHCWHTSQDGGTFSVIHISHAEPNASSSLPMRMGPPPATKMGRGWRRARGATPISWLILQSDFISWQSKSNGHPSGWSHTPSATSWPCQLTQNRQPQTHMAHSMGHRASQTPARHPEGRLSNVVQGRHMSDEQATHLAIWVL